jgi:thymidylate kinase
MAKKVAPKGKFVVFEGIYGSGSIVAEVVSGVREALLLQGRKVEETASPDSGRAQLMGASETVDWKFGDFIPDFFFEIAARSKVCKVVEAALHFEEIVLCKSFTTSSIVWAKLNDADWHEKKLRDLEKNARSIGFSKTIEPDLVIFLDMDVEKAFLEIADSPFDFVSKDTLSYQAQFYAEELSYLRNKSITINAQYPVEDIVKMLVDEIINL